MPERMQCSYFIGFINANNYIFYAILFYVKGKAVAILLFS